MRPTIPWLLPLLPGLGSALHFLSKDRNSKTGHGAAINIPYGLSSTCSLILNEVIQCSTALAAITFDGDFPTDEDRDKVCNHACLSNLVILQADLEDWCLESDIITSGGIAYHPKVIADEIKFAYSYDCLKDESGAYCAPQILAWLNSLTGMTWEQKCSSCALSTFQTRLNWIFRYDEETLETFTSLTAYCGASNYPVTSPTGYTVTVPSTTSSGPLAKPTVDCVEQYTIQDGDNCNTISVAKNVSTHELLYTNHLAAYCVDFPTAGSSLCIPKSCAIHTLVSWNANINRGCTNLNKLVSSQICISSPKGGVAEATGPASTTVAAIPTDVAAGTKTECAMYYSVSPGDDCSRITVMMGITLADFYFLNPQVSSTDCKNLMAGYSYCVRPVGNINTYSGYSSAAGTRPRKCVVSASILTECLAISISTDMYWSFPAPTNARTRAAYSRTIVTATPLPLAPGTASDCRGYEIYRSVGTNKNSDDFNTCDYIAWYAGLDIEDLLLLNPSLTYDDSDPSACVLQSGYRYCIVPVE